MIPLARYTGRINCITHLQYLISFYEVMLNIAKWLITAIIISSIGISRGIPKCFLLPVFVEKKVKNDNLRRSILNSIFFKMLMGKHKSKKEGG